MWATMAESGSFHRSCACSPLLAAHSFNAQNEVRIHVSIDRNISTINGRRLASLSIYQWFDLNFILQRFAFLRGVQENNSLKLRLRDRRKAA